MSPTLVSGITCQCWANCKEVLLKQIAVVTIFFIRNISSGFANFGWSMLAQWSDLWCGSGDCWWHVQTKLNWASLLFYSIFNEQEPLNRNSVRILISCMLGHILCGGQRRRGHLQLTNLRSLLMFLHWRNVLICFLRSRDTRFQIFEVPMKSWLLIKRWDCLARGVWSHAFCNCSDPRSQAIAR